MREMFIVAFIIGSVYGLGIMAAAKIEHSSVADIVANIETR